MIRPTPRAVLLAIAGIGAALPAAFAPSLWPAWLVFLLSTLLLLGLDTLALAPAGRIALDVQVPARVPVGGEGELALAVAVSARPLPARVELTVDLGPDLLPLQPTLVPLDERGEGRVTLELVPERRGTLRVERVWVRWRGPLGLVAGARVEELDHSFAVVPDVAVVRRTALRFFGSPQALAGLKTERYIGDGSEFESLRGWVPGFDPRSIDWKASARHVRLLCRQFRAERNHQVVVAFDCGRLMSEPLAGVPRLDHAITCGLLVAYVGLRTGDRVGLYAFDSRPQSYLEPRGGVARWSRLQAASAALEYRAEETNFTLGVLELTSRLRRRTLVVVFTDFVDSITAELMADNLERLARRHLILFVALRDPGLERLRSARPARLTDVHRAVVAADLARERTLVRQRLQRAGVHYVDATPERVSIDLLNRYLDIRRRELVG